MRHPKYFDTNLATSRRMSKVKLKEGEAETLLAKEIWHVGYRYRKNYKKLPGSPDIAILKYNIAIFVDGEFWHGYDWDNKRNKLNRNRDYWIQKIEENIARDVRVDKELKALGWTPIHFWEKEVKKDLKKCVDAVCDVALQLQLGCSIEDGFYE